MGSFSYCVTVGDVGLVWATPEGKRLLHHQKIAIRQQHYHFFFFFFKRGFAKEWKSSFGYSAPSLPGLVTSVGPGAASRTSALCWLVSRGLSRGASVPGDTALCLWPSPRPSKKTTSF